MTSELPRTALSNLIVHQKGFAFKSRDYQESGFPVVRVSNFTDDSIDTRDLKYVNEKIAAESQKVALKKDDVVIATVGSWPKNPASIVGNTVCVPPEMDGAFMNQNSVILRVKSESEIDQKYLFIALKSKLFSEYLVSKAQGSANQASITLSDIFSYEVEWPEDAVRESMVSMIDSMNQKIKLNTQTNQTLEAIAQAIFKSWFVDFEPVKAKMAALEAGGTAEEAERAAMGAISGKDEAALTQLQTEQPDAYAELAQTAALFPSAMQDSELGEIPEGWKVGTLAELLRFNPKRTLKKGTPAPYLDMKNVPTSGHLAEDVIIREMASGTKFTNGDTLIARITPCLENGKTAYVDFLNDDQVGWGSTEYIVLRPKEGLPTSLGYFIARLEVFRNAAIQSMTGTSGRQRANTTALENLVWLKYPPNLLLAFDKVASQYLLKAKNNGDESRVLFNLRDSLLPKLLSGEIDLRLAADVADEVSL